MLDYGLNLYNIEGMQNMQSAMQGMQNGNQINNNINPTRLNEFKNITYPQEMQSAEKTMYTPNPLVIKSKDQYDLNAIQNMEALQNINIQGLHTMSNSSNNNTNLQSTNSVSKDQTFHPTPNEFKRKESGYVKPFNIQKWIDEYNSNSKDYDFKLVKDRIPEICEHKDGSRVIQEHLDIASDDQIEFIFSMIENKL